MIRQIILGISLIVVISACSENLNEEEMLKQSEVYLENKEYRSAIIGLKKLLQKNNGNVKARYFLGLAHLELGDAVSAEKEFNRAKKLGMGNLEITLYIGKALLLQRKNQEALDLLQLNSSLSRIDKAAILVLRGEAYLQTREFDRARDSFHAASVFDSSLSEPLVGQAKILVQQYKLDDASVYLDKAVQMKSSDKEALILRAEISKLKGNFPQAEIEFNHALQQDKAKNITEYKFRVLAGLVSSQIPQKKLDAASLEINKLVKAWPTHPQVIYLQGWLAFQKQDFELANTMLLDVQKIASNHMQSLLLLGAANYALKQYEQANIHLTRFVSNVPGHAQATKLLASTKLKLNQPEKAMKILQSDVNTSDKELIMMAGKAAALIGKTNAHVEWLKKLDKSEPDNVPIKTELAKAYLQQGSIDKAIAELESIQGTTQNSDNPDLLLIYVQLRAGAFDKARKLAKIMLKNNPNKPAVHAVVGEVESIAGKPALAREHFKNALKLDKNHTTSLISIARLDIKAGKLNEAAKLFDQILFNDKKSIVAMLGHAEIAQKRSQVNTSLSWLEKARAADARAVLPRNILARHYLSVKNSGLALVVTEELNALQPEAAMSLLLLGRAQLLSGQRQKAVNSFKKLVSKSPSSPDSYVELATAQFSVGDIKSARNSLLKSLGLDGKHLKAKTMLANLENKRKEYNKALELVSEIKKEHSDKSAGYHIEGEILVQQKRFKLAQKAFLKANEKEPSALIMIKLSKAYSSAGEEIKAITVLNKGIAAFPDNNGLRITLATRYQLQGNMKAAERHYIKVLEHEPSNVIVLNNMATILADHDPEKALSYARQAYKLIPKNMAVADTYGWLLVTQNQLKDGLNVLTQAASYGDNPTVKYHFAVALVKNANRGKAREVLNALVDSGIKFPEQKQARKLLASLK